MERFHRYLFDQLRTTRLQWSKDLNIEPPMLPQSLYPRHYITASSYSTTTSYIHQGKHLTSRTTAPTSCTLEKLFLEMLGTSRRRSYVSGINIRNFVASGLAETSSRMSTSLHYLCSTANIHLQLLVPTGADRSLLYLGKNNMTSSSWRASTGHSSLMTSISTPESTSITSRSRTSQQEIYIYNNLRMRRTLRTSSSSSCATSRTTTSSATTTSRTTSTTSARQPRPLMVKQQAAPLPAPLLQGPPPKAQAVPVPPAPQAVHRPTGKHYNHPRGSPPKAANSIAIPHEDEFQELLGPNLVDITVDSGKLQVATNIDKKEQLLQEELIKRSIELQDFYEDDHSQNTEDDIKAATASELHSLGQWNIYGEVDIDSLTPEQQRRVIKTRWVIGPCPSSTSADDIDIPLVH